MRITKQKLGILGILSAQQKLRHSEDSTNGESLSQAALEPVSSTAPLSGMRRECAPEADRIRPNLIPVRIWTFSSPAGVQNLR